MCKTPFGSELHRSLEFSLGAFEVLLHRLERLESLAELARSREATVDAWAPPES